MNSGRAAIIGAGSWGTALALILAEKGIDISLWGHRAEHVLALKEDRENRAYLPGFLFLPIFGRRNRCKRRFLQPK